MSRVRSLRLPSGHIHFRVGRESRRKARILRFRLEELEKRRLLSYTVNDSGDAPLDPSKGPAETSNGTISLRSAIQQVDIDGSGEIDFSVSMVNCGLSHLSP